MTIDDFLDEYSQAIDRQSQADKAVKLLEMRAKLVFSVREPTKSKNELFIEANRSELYEEDIEFLSKETRSFAEVAEYRGDSATPNKNWLKKHGIEAVKLDGVARKQISTLDVFKAYRDGKT